MTDNLLVPDPVVEVLSFCTHTQQQFEISFEAVTEHDKYAKFPGAIYVVHKFIDVMTLQVQ